MRVAVPALCLVIGGACSFSPSPAATGGSDAGGIAMGGDGGSSTPQDAGSGGASADAPPVCYGTGPAMTCLDNAPTAAYPGGPMTVDTDISSTQCRSDVTLPKGNTVCVIAYTSILLDDTISAHGSRPLVIVSADDFTIQGNGIVDAGSHGSGDPQAVGPAANGSCNGGLDGVHGGGPGGSFAGLGGGGGTPNGLSGIAGFPPSSPSALRGGCPGNDGDSSPGSHGDGGGAVALVTNATLEIDGYIDASGAFGSGGNGQNYGGGGGGGTGGMIEIAADTVTGAGQVFAAGGGGGEGGENNNGTATDGKAGNDPTTSSFGAGAAGGDGFTTDAGAGGNGNGTNDVFPTYGNGGQSGTGSVHVGGGGGGGSSGYLFVHVTTNMFTGTTSPGGTAN
jgi:hypothetical protein